MSFEQYINGVTFKFLQPDRPKTKFYERLDSILSVFNYSLEIINTSIQDDEGSMKKNMKEICRIPKMSTFAIGAMINRGVRQMPDDQIFVNIGVWNGFTLFSGLLNNPRKKCVGVDNFSECGGPRAAFYERFNRIKSPHHYFYEMNYIEYFQKLHTGSIGFYIYDGHHSYENQLMGLQLAEPFFSKDCIILVDDINWDEPRKATLDFIARTPNKYRILFERNTCQNSHPTLWNGIVIFKNS
jgi:hypothetical protein